MRKLIYSNPDCDYQRFVNAFARSLDRFPTIPDIATEFIKVNGFKAQEKRRDTTITSCGVSAKDINEHLCQAILGLREFGISNSTIRYSFKLVKKRTFSSEVGN